MKKYLLSVIACFTLLGCQTHSSKSAVASAPAAGETEANLTSQEASMRRAAVGEVAYDLEVDLRATGENFAAKATVIFDLKQNTPDLFLDFKDGAQVESVKINGGDVKVVYRAHRISLPQAALKIGSNTVAIGYKQTYSHDGRGLHRFVDPEDQKVYLYSQFESYDAHQMFPCFDQPDIKATMKMRVMAPKGWEVITTTRESKVSGELWTFPETPKLSTYLFSLHAGPYHKWEDKAGAIPMRLFVRQTLAKYVRTKDWFVPTRQGLQFYGEYFHYPYPFKKYDQVIAPDFNAGAMENVAAITFSEYFIKRGMMTREDREGIASVILHEMAHMWFGDLVTMQWWNGLWLNESFATFMSSLSQFKATEFKESWERFYRHEKQWAYWTDQLVTTHPIEAQVPDVATAFTNFDGITYGKGASVLKQLNFYLGADVFRDGVRSYISKHAYTGTNLRDFIGALETVSKKDLSGWSSAWLEQGGLDSVEPVYTCEGGRVTRFALKAKGPANATTPRVHKTRITLYSDKLKKFAQADIEYTQGETEVKALVGKACPSLVDPNDEDHDYAKARLDARTLATVQTRVLEIPSAFMRLRLWPILHEMVRDSEIAPAKYLEIAGRALPAEKDLDVVQEITKPLLQHFYYLPEATAQLLAERTKWIGTFEAILWKRAQSEKPGSDFQKILFMKFVEIAQSTAARDHLVGILNGTEKLKKLTVDEDLRWSVIVQLSSLGDPRAVNLAAAQAKADGSERGIQMAAAAAAARPDVAAKRIWFNDLQSRDDIKYARARTAMRAVLPPWQENLRATFADDFYKSLADVAVKRQIDIAELFTSAFVPTVCTSESAERLNRFIAANPKLPPAIRKELKIEHQEDARCAGIRTSKRE
jgi:aminopeptidase N